MSEAERLEVETPPETEAGFCHPFDEVLLIADDIERAREDPEPLAPPMANVRLAIELSTGLDAIREVPFHGKTYQLRPTPYDTALRLLSWSQELERFLAMRQIPPDDLPDLRTAYAEIVRLIGTLLVKPVELNPFLEADAPEVRFLLGVALDVGNELPVVQPRRNADDPATRYDAAFYLLRYLDRCGSIPGMVVLREGRPCPASWRHFAAGMGYIRRADAEASLGLFAAYGATQSTEEGQERWLALQRREIGL